MWLYLLDVISVMREGIYLKQLERMLDGLFGVA